MLCLSGDEEYCDYARKSQGPDGMFWRSPGFIVSEDQPLTRDNEFSRDMAMGVFAYLVATKDTEAATRWIDYIDSNDNKLCMPNHDKDKPPETCATRAGFWATAMEVWDYLGLEYSSRMKGFKRTLINVYSPIELAVEPINSEITLPMDWIYIMEEIQRRSGGSTGPEHLTTKQVRILAHRMPDSPIVRFLAEGPNQQSADDLMRYCARQKPIGRRLDEHGVPIYNWIWDHHLDNPAYIENSTGWDCILLINMMISANQEKV